MDKKTAIDLLDNLLGMVEDNHESDYDTAIKMGIDALSNAPNALSTLDCVDRQAALEAMDTWDKFGCDPDGKLVKYDDDKHYIPYVDYEDMVHAIKHLPSVQPQRWIPVTEALPEKPFGCLVTVMDTEPMTMEEFENILPYFVGYDGEQWNDWEGYQCPFEVLAWMPLPEPWRGKE